MKGSAWKSAYVYALIVWASSVLDLPRAEAQGILSAVEGGKVFNGTYDTTVSGNQTGVLIQTPLLKPQFNPFGSGGPGNGSQLDFVITPSIDMNGTVYSGSGSGGGRGHAVMAANHNWTQDGRFYWWSH
jgi:hypothetical protein